MILAQIEPKLMKEYTELWVEEMIAHPENFSNSVDEVLDMCDTWLAYPTNLKLTQIAAANAEFMAHLLLRLAEGVRGEHTGLSHVDDEFYDEVRRSHQKACALATRVAGMLQQTIGEKGVSAMYQGIWDQLLNKNQGARS